LGMTVRVAYKVRGMLSTVEVTWRLKSREI
jgi:hypothetical protein